MSSRPTWAKLAQNRGWVQWLKPVIPATQEAEIRRISVQVLGKNFERPHLNI
jgi:hypothetical protein